MNLNENSNPKSQHALFSPSQPAWIDYTKEEFIRRLIAKYYSDIGTIIHDISAIKIDLGHKVKNAKDVIKDAEFYIYKTYFKDAEKYDIRKKAKLNKIGYRLLRSLKHIPNESVETVKAYINDAIGFKMKTEVRLEYSDDFFGTCDAIKADKNSLRIHDLKTGSTPAHMDQLLVYEALYCLQNDIDPYKLQSELRIYQSNDILIANPTGDEIVPVMETIKMFDSLTLKFEGGLL